MKGCECGGRFERVDDIVVDTVVDMEPGCCQASAWAQMYKVRDGGALVLNRCARLKYGHAGNDQIPDSNIRCGWLVDAGYRFDRWFGRVTDPPLKWEVP